MRNPFAAYHPTVALVYLVCAILFCMLAFHPVYVGLSFAGAFAASLAVKGARATFSSLRLAVVLCAVMALANMLFVSAGSHVLFVVFGHPCYLEALCYGLCTGCMFAGMLLWFMVYANVMDSEATSTVMGKFLPTVSLMISQVLRLVPQFLRRGAAIGAVQAATSAAAPRTKKESLGQYARTLSVLMGWGMEDGLQRTDAMRARGYGCGRRRTRYRRQRFAARDAALLVFIVALAAANAFLASVACSQFSFYPYMDTLVMWWGYLPYIVFVALPVGLALRERAAWH